MGISSPGTGVNKFLRDWYAGQPFTLTALDPDRGGPTGQNFTDPDAGAAWAQMQNAVGRNVYFHVNPGINTHVSEKTGQLSGKLSKAELTTLHAVHVDIDPPKDITADQGNAWRMQALGTLAAMNPTYIVGSGRGLAAYWKFTGPIAVADMPRIETMNRGLCAMLGGDRAATDASRIMKLPGTIAHPNADKRAAGWQAAPAQVLHDGGQQYEPIALETWVTANAPTTPAVETVATGDLAEELPDGPSPRYGGPSDDEVLLNLMQQHYDRLKPGLQAWDFFAETGDVPSDAFRARAQAIAPDTTKQAPWDFDGSAIDQTLINHLMYYTGGDAQRVKRLWLRSIMGKRDKLAGGKRSDYVQRSLWKVKREFDANPDPKMLARDKPSLERLTREFMQNPTETGLLSEVAKLTATERAQFVEDTYKCVPDMTKAQLTAAVKDAVVGAKKLATAERGLIFDQQGNPVQNLENCRRVLINDQLWAGVFQYSEFDDRIWCIKPIPGDTRGAPTPRKYTDADALFTMSWFQSNGFSVIGDKTVRNAIIAAAHANSFHQVRDYLNALQWDGVPRLHALFVSYFPCEVRNDVAGWLEYLQTAGQRFTIGAVARIMQPGCKLDTMPVLSGAQGLGKSTGFSALFGEHWSGPDMPDITSKDAKEWVRGKWLAEFAEMASVGGKDVDHIKNFMSTATDSFRKSYGHTTEDVPRQIVFGGSVNGDQYLMDETGNRRFWPMRVMSRVEVESIRRDRDQLWAEAVQLYAAGNPWWFNQGECAALEVAQEDARVIDEDENFVREWLAMQRDDVTSSQVLRAVFPDKDGNRANSMRIARYMKACGWEPGNRTAKERRWHRTDRAQPHRAPGVGNVVPLHSAPGA